MKRVQILLSNEQDRRLREIVPQGKSISEVVRQILDAYFAEQDRRVQENALKALAELDRIRQKVAEQYGVYEGDLVNEARLERESQMEDVWKQWS